MWANENRYDPIIKSASVRFGVPQLLIKAVIAAESGFKPDAYRAEPQIEDASRGLMQVLRKTAEALGYSGDDAGLFEPYTNINLGTMLLSRERARAGDWPGAISAYNGGYRPALGFGERVTRRGVRCMGRIVPVGEFCNQEYVDRVRRYWTYFETGEMPESGFARIGVALVLGGLALFPFGLAAAEAATGNAPALNQLFDYLTIPIAIGVGKMMSDVKGLRRDVEWLKKWCIKTNGAESD